MIQNWSYSRYNTYNNCPRKAKYLYIDKLPEPPSEAINRGVATHKLAEDYLNGTGKLPEELAKFRRDFLWLRKEGARAEMELSLDREWMPTDWKAGWWRGKIDAILKADPFVVVDFKTGKVRESHHEQLSLYALACFSTFTEPSIQLLTVELWYLDSGERISGLYWPDDAPKIKETWQRKTEPMLADNTFACRPGPLCNWCHFRKANGGPCEF